MANPLQQLLALTQGGQPMSSGMAATGPSDMVSETPDIVSQLKALMGGSGGAPMMPQTPQPGPAGGPMLAALQDRMSGIGIPQVGPDVSKAMSLGTNYGRGGPGTDSEYYEMHDANQSVRGDLPPQPTRDYSGYGEEMEPMDDPRQTPPPAEGPGNPKYDKTKAELDDISKRMGSGDPVEDGNFPSQKEINDLVRGKVDPKAFDAKWGKGAAAEMMQQGEEPDDEPDGDTDDGDHEYR